MKDLNDAKEKINKLTFEEASNRKSIASLSSEVTALKFENETLRSYNQTLLRKLEEAKPVPSGRTFAYRQPVS